MNGMSWAAQYVHILGVLLPVFVCAGIGVGWAVKKLHFPGEFISTLVTSVTTPALVFHTIATTELHDTMLLQILGATCAGIAIMACVAALMLRALRLPVASLLPSATFPNGGNLGLPISYLAFGEIGLAVAVTVFAIFSLSQHTLGVGLLSMSSNANGSVKRKLPWAIVLSCGAAIFLRTLDIQLPAPFLASAKLVGSITVPLMLISLGFALATVSRSSLGAGTLVGSIRLLSGLAGAVVVIFGMNLLALVSAAIALQLLMPVAVASYLYTERFTSVGAISAGAVLASTGIFIVVSPLLITWMTARI